MERFKRNFQSYVKYNPMEAVKKRLEDIRTGKYEFDDNYSPSKSHSPLKLRNIEAHL